jgi:uncharacterized protein (TIGR02677 family)
MTDLGRLIGEEQGEASEPRFVAFKQALLAYVSRFVEDLRRLREDIADGIAAVQAAGTDRIVETASRSADLPDFARDGAARARWAAEQRGRWEGICAWFMGTAEAEPTVERLASFAVGAVLCLTRTLSRLNDRRGRPVDRRTDFHTLARWFAECSSDAAAHVLWHVAFGLHGARHFQHSEEDPERTSTRASWWDAEPIAVPTRLRTHGRVPHQGRPSPAADYSRERQWLEARVRRERAQVEAAVARFAGRSLRLSDIGDLDAGEFDLLLTLLDAALSAPPEAGGLRRTRTADGQLEIALRPPSGGATCSLETPGGRLTAPDFAVTVADLTTSRATVPAAAEVAEAAG